jgi:hypothetical protein
MVIQLAAIHCAVKFCLYPHGIGKKGCSVSFLAPILVAKAKFAAT